MTMASATLRGRPGSSSGHGPMPPRGGRSSAPVPRPSPPGPRASAPSRGLRRPAPPRRPPSWRPPGRIVHSVRPSSSLNENGRTMPSAMRRSNESEAPMRWPFASSRASGTRSRCDQSRSASACASADGIGAGQRVAEQLGPGAHALAHDLLVADALVVEVALEDPARDQREQQQHHDDRGVDAQVEALHGRDGALMPRRRRRPASSRTRSRRRAR